MPTEANKEVKKKNILIEKIPLLKQGRKKIREKS